MKWLRDLPTTEENALKLKLRKGNCMTGRRVNNFSRVIPHHIPLYFSCFFFFFFLAEGSDLI
jgi:hypothetical protein